MNKFLTFTAMLGMVLSATGSSAATAPPKVVFIGDYITFNWTSGFAANPNWVNQGVNGASDGGQTSPPDIDAAINLHPAIIHILMGANISISTCPNCVVNELPFFAQSLDTMVKKAQAANIKVILGLSPGGGADAGYGDFDHEFINSIVAAYGAANNIEVINYADALCQCIGSVSQDFDNPNAFQQITLIPNQSGSPLLPTSALLPTKDGYALMTQMAQTAIANEYLTIQSGYLSDVALQNFANGILTPIANINTCGATCVVQFTPIGYYSDGRTHPQNNTTWGGSNGSWTSSNPLVMSVNQQGLAYALTDGTATIKYLPASGVKFNSWVMHIEGCLNGLC